MTHRIRQLVESKPFHHVIVAVIVLAGVVAGLETSPAIMAQHGPLLHGLDKIILGIFVIEAALKLAMHGRRPWRYFADGWNVFDFLIVMICLLPVGGPFAAVLRLARALRLLRLVSALPKLQLLVGALLKSLSAMGYVSLLLALLFYIYAVAGIHLFGAHDPANFGSLPAAFLSLFQLVTLDNWSELFHAQTPFVSGLKVGVYFVTFIVFGTMIILNLFIGIIMNSMSEMHAEIAERDRAQHERATGSVSLADELRSLEQELQNTQTRLAALRHRSRSHEWDGSEENGIPVAVRFISRGNGAS